VFRSLWSGRYAHYLLLTFFVMFGLYLPQPLTPNYLQNLRGVGLVVMGQLISMRSLGVVAFNIILDTSMRGWVICWHRFAWVCLPS